MRNPENENCTEAGSRKTIRQIPDGERPYEKCLRLGPEGLTDAELLAVILRTGTKGISSIRLADEVLDLCRFNRGLTGIYHLSVDQLCSISGVGRVKALQVICIGELSKRIAQTSAAGGLNFCDPATIAAYYMETMRHEEQEVVRCMMLNVKNRMLGDVLLTRGTVNLSLISPRELFISALSFHAVHMILVHNHPSGDASPSDEDIRVTRRIRDAGELLGIDLLDHIIIGDRCYTSLREQYILDTRGV
ncbi:MAG: DNA repair protein RadC [Lachnospiraceae bacterium]|jgi:DNA repair protein RadC|nr:DNA repair protein RadC [Lachnospiraceae bacterium]MCI1329187.1 DNA repair protein RadC [Lachnospiraceae bacterium]